MKRIAIITEDSTVMLPEIDSWKGKIGRGTKIPENKSIHELLINSGMNLPTVDVAREAIYKEALNDFIRPARLMNGGSFSEIRSFHSKPKQMHPANPYIISGRYGLTKGESKVVPHFAPISDIDKAEGLELCHKISKSMLEVSSTADFLTISLPSYFMKYLMQKGWFEKASNLSQMVVVCASSFRRVLKDYDRISILDRIGVAKLGKKNQVRIMEILSS